MASSALNSVIGNPLSTEPCLDFLSVDSAATSDGRSITSVAMHEKAIRRANPARGFKHISAARGQGFRYRGFASKDASSRGICVRLTPSARESCSAQVAMFPKDSHLCTLRHPDPEAGVRTLVAHCEFHGPHRRLIILP